MTLGETCWITKEGITRWFHKTRKNLFIKNPIYIYISADYAIIRCFLFILSHFVKPTSGTLLRYSPSDTLLCYFNIFSPSAITIISTIHINTDMLFLISTSWFWYINMIISNHKLLLEYCMCLISKVDFMISRIKSFCWINSVHLENIFGTNSNDVVFTPLVILNPYWFTEINEHQLHDSIQRDIKKK
jgi:hypothetical protein